MKHLKRSTVLAVAIAALLVPSATATAATAPGYEEFGACPDRTVDATMEFCVVNKVVDGHLQLGSKNTPITDPITLTFGLSGTFDAVLGEFDGGRQRVPGGLVGITGLDWLTLLYPGNLLKVYAEAELAGPVTNPFGPIGLPLKVHLDNPLLSDSCYIGSDSDPVDLNLTSGTTNPPPPNQPITGQEGTAVEDPNLPGVQRSTGIILVDNEFAAPAARGCDLVSIGLGAVDALVNLQAGLPSPAGTNETVQEVEGAFGHLPTIYPPDGIEQ